MTATPFASKSARHRRTARVAAGWVTLLLLPLMAACRSEPPSVVGQVTTTTPNATAPLARLVEFTTDRPAIATIEISDGERQWSVSGSDELQTSHAVTVVGIHPARSHSIGVTLRTASGSERTNAATGSFDTAPLPDDFPPIEVPISEPDRMEPGVTVFPVLIWEPEGSQNYGRGLVIAVDARGEIVWYFDAPFGISAVEPTDRGTFICQGWHTVVEIDLLGNVIDRWYATRLAGEPPAGAIRIETDMFHNEVAELPSGEIVALSSDPREFDDFPSSYADPTGPRAPATVIDEVVVQFQRDGTTTGRWSMLDLLDPYRIAYASLSPYYDSYYPEIEGGTKDWGHSNGIAYDARDDTLIVSLRSQDAVVKFNRSSGELVWILGDHAGWTERWQPYLLEPEGDLEWPYHQHRPVVTPDGTLLLFDNGTYKAIPPAPAVAPADNYSRAVEYAIDEEAMTVRQVWSFGGPDEPFYSPFLGGVAWLPETGNILVADGGRVVDEEGVSLDIPPLGRKFGRIVEVTHTDEPETVFELVIDTGEKPGWSIYRAERLAALQPE